MNYNMKVLSGKEKNKSLMSEEKPVNSSSGRVNTYPNLVDSSEEKNILNKIVSIKFADGVVNLKHDDILIVKNCSNELKNYYEEKVK